MDVSKEVDRRIVINGIVTEMLKSGGVNIEICFDGRMSVSLSKDEILGIIKEMKYDGYYDEDRNVYKIWKIPHIFDSLMDRDFLYHYLEELKEDKYIEKYGNKFLDLSDLKLHSDEIAEMIREAGYSWYFEDVKKVWIL